MLDPDKIKHKGLKRFAERSDTSGLRPDWVRKIRVILTMLNAAASPEELNVPGFGWHELKGDRKGTYSTVVSRNQRLTFRWDTHGPTDVMLEDYHGR